MAFTRSDVINNSPLEGKWVVIECTCPTLSRARNDNGKVLRIIKEHYNFLDLIDPKTNCTTSCEIPANCHTLIVNEEEIAMLELAHLGNG